MPFVSLLLLQEELRILMEDPSLAFVIPRSEYGFEPMHAVYRRSKSLPAVKAALDRGERRMISWHGDVDSPFYLEIDQVRRFDPDGLAFMNLNTPEEFTQAEQLAARLSGK
jgi:molybdopterin-guanine dinucleotide biosynthesis protein A